MGLDLAVQSYLQKIRWIVLLHTHFKSDCSFLFHIIGQIWRYFPGLLWSRSVLLKNSTYKAPSEIWPKWYIPSWICVFNCVYYLINHSPVLSVMSFNSRIWVYVLLFADVLWHIHHHCFPVGGNLFQYEVHWESYPVYFDNDRVLDIFNSYQSNFLK